MLSINSDITISTNIAQTISLYDAIRKNKVVNIIRVKTSSKMHYYNRPYNILKIQSRIEMKGTVKDIIHLGD